MAQVINIRTSEANKGIVQDLTRKLQFTTENHISRVAFAYSIAKEQKLSLETDLKDSRGKEYKEDTFFGNKRSFYIALVCQLYGLHKTDPDIAKYIKMHVDHGLELMWKLFYDNKNYSGLDFLIDQIEKGIDALEEIEVPQDHIQNTYLSIEKSYFSDVIPIKIGTEMETGNEVIFRINDTTIHNNHHVAVAGNSGTGKTYFAKFILKQIAQSTQGKVNFVFIDFKGLKKEDIEENRAFFEDARTTLVDAPQQQFPVNPLAFIDTINEKNRIMGINKFVSILGDYAELGPVQQQTLRDATRAAFANVKSGSYPSFKDIKILVRDAEGNKPSKLSKILEDISDLELFQIEVDPRKSFLQENFYFSLSGDLSPEVRYTATFLIINYIYNTFMNMSNAPNEGGVQSIRYILLIDEAHTIFKQRKAQELLEKILREIRSKGVSVILLSQGIEEFNQPSFDFSSMCETAFLFDIKDKTNARLLNKFMGFGEGSKEAKKLKEAMEKIMRYQIVSNLKEVHNCNLIVIN